MANKPSYEELEQRVKELEKEALEGNIADGVLNLGGEGKTAVLNSLTEHVVYQDLEMRILWANQAACRSVDMALEELAGRHCYEIWAQRLDPCEDCPIKRAGETGEPESVEKTTPDGRSWFIRGYPV